MDTGAWWAAVYGVTQSRTWLKRRSMNACTGGGNGNPPQYSCLENPRTEKPGGLPSTELHRLAHDWRDLAAAAQESYWIILGKILTMTLNWQLLTVFAILLYLIHNKHFFLLLFKYLLDEKLRNNRETSLVAKWLRIRLSIHGTWVCPCSGN